MLLLFFVCVGTCIILLYCTGLLSFEFFMGNHRDMLAEYKDGRWIIDTIGTCGTNLGPDARWRFKQVWHVSTENPVHAFMSLFISLYLITICRMAWSSASGIESTAELSQYGMTAQRYRKTAHSHFLPVIYHQLNVICFGNLLLFRLVCVFKCQVPGGL